MGRNKRLTSEVEEPLVEVELSPADDDALLLKVDHTHAGKKYVAGTSVGELGLDEARLNYLKDHGIV